MRVLTANIGRARNATAFLCSLKVDVHPAIPEYKLDASLIPNVAKACFARGWRGIWTLALVFLALKFSQNSGGTF